MLASPGPRVFPQTQRLQICVAVWPFQGWTNTDQCESATAEANSSLHNWLRIHTSAECASVKSRTVLQDQKRMHQEGRENMVPLLNPPLVRGEKSLNFELIYSILQFIIRKC